MLHDATERSRRCTGAAAQDDAREAGEGTGRSSLTCSSIGVRLTLGDGRCKFWAAIIDFLRLRCAGQCGRLMMRLAQVTYVLPDGSAGLVGAPTQAERDAYEEVWRVVELLRLVGGSPHWWDASFGGSVASTMSLRERLLFSDAVRMPSLGWR